ncbi:hypothetical protein CC80DRAFT_514738 [Byssothecium circinans]|uniref:BHLH domain-containing protein n=1 Tax=Byssothecium circinans TaxID=147558 RepID=A0A6A5U210_9PLEO|nr:hypothetical protein CC80DRAFT_514738 [Byssothecium circinans]
MDDVVWSGGGHFDPSDQQDFGFLDLDLDNIDLDFDFGAASASDPSPQLGQLSEELDLQHLYSPAQVAQEHHNGSGAQQAHSVDGRAGAQAGKHYFDFSMPPYTQNAPAYTQPQEHMFRMHAPVPPTPNSLEMHNNQARYMQQMDAQQAVFEQRFPMRQDDMTFTPLVSPAVTPHEARFRIQDGNAISNHFSPLTSPALNAQPYSQSHAQYRATSGGSTGASPIDADKEMSSEPAVIQEEQGRKLRRNKRSAPRSAAPARIRQSPIVKPGRRKATVSSLIPPKDVSDLMEEARGNRSYAGGIDARLSRDSSETNSISPEPLSEMGPPPKPASVTPSPAMLAQKHQALSQGVTPATPASLMRIHPSPTFGVPEVPPLLDDLTLPEASLERPPLSHLDTAIHDDEQDTPRLSARKTPKLSAQGTPSGLAAMSGKDSPMLSGVSTPTSPAFAPTSSRKADSKSGRLPKKRNSVGSNLVSPALRPKISPSIKPLLPDGGVSSDTHALLLASKSNYQNILDGTTVPGVVYPTSLSNNLTSKRTSHKMAEQGRRNRINTALQEMQALLPSPDINAKDTAKSPDTGGPQSNNSKAAKVESAIEYIKQLQQQCFDKDRLLDRKDQEMEALRKELAALKANSSTEAIAASINSPAAAKEDDT